MGRDRQTRLDRGEPTVRLALSGLGYSWDVPVDGIQLIQLGLCEQQNDRGHGRGAQGAGL